MLTSAVWEKGEVNQLEKKVGYPFGYSRFIAFIKRTSNA